MVFTCKNFVTTWLPTILTGIFFIALISILLRKPRIFMKRHGRMHSIVGLSYLILILLKFVVHIFRSNHDSSGTELSEPEITKVVYDAVLGIFGIFLPLTAAFEFKHYNVINTASGTLDEFATVTHSEMLEHSFYQGLNLLQILFLHTIIYFPSVTLETSCIYISVVTSPWLFRHLFPVNKFSDNYMKIDPRSSPFTRLLYRIKKYQYLFYKHFILHGLNITVLLDSIQIANQWHFQLFWILLNMSYVMEFFLQTLVKKKYLSQSSMLVMQQILMLASTVSAISLLSHLRIWICLFSLLLNFVMRKNDFLNTFFLFSLAWLHKLHFQ